MIADPSARRIRLARRAIMRRIPYGWYEAVLTDAFHSLFYRQRGRTWENTRWLGWLVEKFPTDMVVYQEILYELRPDVIVETGTAYGGSALFLASLCDLIGHGRVVTVDAMPQPELPDHQRITYLVGSSTDPDILTRVGSEVAHAERTMVILDSDHSCSHVAAELRAYQEFVTPGSYLIVEDTNQSGHPVADPRVLGPWEAVSDFLAANPDFERDPSREKFFLTANPSGYLRRRSR